MFKLIRIKVLPHSIKPEISFLSVLKPITVSVIGSANILGRPIYQIILKINGIVNYL